MHYFNFMSMLRTLHNSFGMLQYLPYSVTTSVIDIAYKNPSFLDARIFKKHKKKAQQNASYLISKSFLRNTRYMVEKSQNFIQCDISKNNTLISCLIYEKQYAFLLFIYICLTFRIRKHSQMLIFCKAQCKAVNLPTFA